MKRMISLAALFSSLLVSTVIYAATPSVSSWNTGGSTTNVNELQAIVITFNSNPTLNSSTVTSSNIYLRTGISCTAGTTPAFSLTPVLGNPTSTVTITPTTPLTSGATYVACATSGIKNTADVSLTATVKQAFTVRDYLLPTISTYLPNPPSGVQSGTNPSIVITFSEAMTTSTITTSSVLLENLTDGGSVALNSPTFSGTNTIATFTLPSVLATPKTYRVTVKNTVQDVAGNAMLNDFSWSFSIDSTAPTVISYAPFSAASPIYVNSTTPTISAVFSEAITTPVTNNFYLKQGSTTIATTPSFNSTTNTASLALSGGLTNNLTYTATLVGVAGTNGNSTNAIKDTVSPTPNKLASSVNWSFIVDTQAPVIAAVSPVSDAANVATNSNIVIDFTENQALNESTINQSNVRVNDGTQDISAVLSYAAGTKRLTITPAGGFNYSTTYTVLLGGGLADKAGNLLPDYSWSFSTQPVSSVSYSQIPPFLTAPVAPNILIILDNSNSMDEDMKVNAIGSPFCTNAADPNTCSKSIIARKALTNVITTYADKMRIGLMSYSLNAPSANDLHNTFYFASYDQSSYCPNPPAACNNYCVNEGAADRDACNTVCQSQNDLFDATYRDDMLKTGTTAGSARRTSYCSIIYPKYQTLTDPAGTKVYYGLPGTFYAGSNQGTRYLYSEAYTSSIAGNDSYKLYDTKIGSSDGNSGYSGLQGTSSFGPTDTDLALGFEEWGRRMYWYHTSRTWFRNDSPGGGYLQVQANLNNPANNTQKDALLTKLGGNRVPAAYQNDETGYMTCESGSGNTCAHIINAGLTPTAGTLETAKKYLNGTLTQGTLQPTPIQNSCQKTFVIYVTDGLPSVSESGTSGTASTLLPAVLTKLDNLRCPTTSTSDNCKVTKTIGADVFNYDVKTFVIGMGLNDAAKSSLDSMAAKGGTAVGGKAYYANDMTALNNALIVIFQNILSELSSGTAASILNNSEGSGANMLQAVFYPKKTFGGTPTTECTWVGEMQNLWYHVDPFFNNSSIREDTTRDNILNLKTDYIAKYYFDDATSTTKVQRFVDLDGNGVGDTAATTILPDDVKNLWRAGRQLWERDLSTAPRNILLHTGFTVAADGVALDDASTGLAPFSSATSASTDLIEVAKFRTWLQAADATEAAKIVDFVHGVDQIGYRGRTVTIESCGLADCTRTWKLGDIISSTPKLTASVQLNSYNNESPNGYGDSSYEKYIKSRNYKDKGMAFVGANDGLLHAFKLGKLTELNEKERKAKLEGSGLGDESWAFMPRNTLPYLKYLTENSYAHLNFVDGPTLVTDISSKPTTLTAAEIAAYPGCDAANYWKCPKKTTYSSAKVCSNNSSVTCSVNSDCGSGNICEAILLDPAKTSWNTVLIGSTGLGGSSRNYNTACVGGGTDCVKTPVNNTGYSSYFALDITNPANPNYLWEFDGAKIVTAAGQSSTAEDGTTLSADGELGFATTGPVIVRAGDRDKNGRWFAVFASGPTGPIDVTDRQFMGRSDQTLKLFVIDIAKGSLVKVLDTGKTNAFAGSLSNSAIDTDRSKKTDSGYYQDDALYIGYTQYNPVTTKWDKGGVLRVLTNELVDPNDVTKPWKVSTVMDSIGPVTTAVTKLQDRSNGNLWLYFGTGRYFYKTAAERDTPTTANSIYGVQEPCYNSGTNDFFKADTDCTLSITLSDLEDKSTDATAKLASGKKGWYVNLDPTGVIAGKTYEAERIITDPVASTGGNVLFTSFKPTSDVCGYNGKFHIWAFDYATGGVPPARTMQGQVLVQSSTGAFESVSLASQMTDKGGRRSGAYTGTPPKAQGLSLMTNPRPVKKIMHIMER